MSATFARSVAYRAASVVRRARAAVDPRRFPNVLVLFVYAEKARYAEAHELLMRLLDGLPAGTWRLIKINNFSEGASPVALGDDAYVIGGDNSAWEFSGWRHGLRSELASSFQADVVLFVNDAFLNASALGLDLEFYRGLFNRFTLRGLNNAALGIVDHMNSRCEIDGHACDWWLRSNIFAMDRALAEKLRWVYHDASSVHTIMSETWDGSIFLEQSPMSEDLRSFLARWVTKDWHRASDVDGRNWARVRSKLTAIINERLLSADLRERGADVLVADRLSVLRGVRSLVHFER